MAKILTENIKILILFLLGFFLRVFNVFFIPKFYAPDEEPHYKYIQYLLDFQKLPVSKSVTDSHTNDWEYYQPPLYYLCNYFFGTFINDFHLFRIFSCLTFIGVFFFSYKILKELKLNETIIFYSLCFVSLLPSYVFLSSVINNDNLLILLSLYSIWVTISARKKWDCLLLGIVLGLAFITKLSAVIPLVFVVSYLFLSQYREKVLIKNYLFILIPILIITFPMFYRNFGLYGTLTGENLVNERWIWEGKEYISRIFNEFNRTFIAVAGKTNDLRPKMFFWIDVLFGLSVIGYVLSRNSVRRFFTKNKSLVISIIFSLIVNFLLIASFGYLYNQPQGRFMFPLIIFCAAIFGGGMFLFQQRLKMKGNIWQLAVFLMFMLILSLTYREFFKSGII